MKQISLSMPEMLFKATQEYTKTFGYKNLQEFILDLLRHRVMLNNMEKYRKIEEKMDKKARSMSQKEAIEFINNF